jgi:hypothetical protein
LRDRPHGGEGPTERLAWEYAVPPGWTPLDPVPQREFGFRVPGHPEAEATFNLAGGDVVANVNRWRGQMTLEPLDAAAIEALPRHPFLGRPATLVELEGTYVGMRRDKSLAGFKFLGLVGQLPNTGAFLKIIGPAAVVDAERERFLDLAASIRPKAAGAPPAPPAEPRPAPAPPLNWTAPPEWDSAPGKGSMRLVTFKPKGATKTEAWITLLAGEAGGVAPNLELWATQVGAALPTPEQIQALPRAKVLSGEAVFATFEGSKDGEALMLLGAIVPHGSHTAFVKMVGPAAEVGPERERFRAFVESFRE